MGSREVPRHGHSRRWMQREGRPVSNTWRLASESNIQVFLQVLRAYEVQCVEGVQRNRLSRASTRVQVGQLHVVNEESAGSGQLGGRAPGKGPQSVRE